LFGELLPATAGSRTTARLLAFAAANRSIKK
jgi:hypothetical protein